MHTISCLTRALIATVLLAAPNLGAQQVTGRVLDQRSGQPLAAVQVFIAGSGVGALSQQNGRYLLLNVPAGTHTLTAERIGYRAATQQVVVAAGQTVVQDFSLTEEALGLDEIIVTGTPGGTQRRAIGNAVLSVQAAEVTQTVAVSSMQDLLGGRSPGLQFTRVAGDVGQGAGIQIRGVGSFNLSSDPLIFVDGVRVNNSSTAGPNVGSGRQASTLNDFNPEDIESIEIIKGPAAATLYGTEASAGVVQIITKRGAEGAAQFEASISEGLNFMKDPAARIGTMWSCSATFAPPCNETAGGLFSYNMYDEANRQIREGAFPWPTENLYQHGLNQSYNLSVRGGTQAIRYFLSGNYDDAQGVIWWNTDKALHMRANVGVVFSEDFSLDVSTGFVDGDTRFASPVAGDGGVWDDMVWGNGHCLPHVDATVACARLKGFQEHLPSDVADIEATREYSRFTGSMTLNVTPTDWLTSRAILGMDKEWNTNRVFFPVVQNWVYRQTQIGEITLERPITANVSLDLSSTANIDVTSAIGTSTSVGVQYYRKTLEDFGNTGRGFASSLASTVNQTQAAQATINYNYIENKSVGFYVQEQLDWNDRIFITAAIRFDDNSAFGSEFDLEKYPKVAATWTVSEESFWNVDLINSLRLRGAWGKAGRQPDVFAGTNQYGIFRGPGGTNGLTPTSPGNPAVGPETSTEIEVGFDVAVLDGRVAAEFTYFNKRNEDALLGVALPSSVGSGGSAQVNLGRIDNWGWEATVSNRIYESPNLTVSLNLSAEHVDNEIKSLGDFPGNNAVRIGYPYPSYQARFWITEAEFDPAGPIANAWGQKVTGMCDSGRRLGDGPQYGLVRGGTPINCATKDTEQILFGPAFYTHRFSVAPTIGLFNNSVQLTALAEGAYGKHNMDGGQDAGSRYNNSRASRVENDPFWIAGDRYGTRQVGGYYRAGFWKLREVGLRYNLPESVIARLGAERAALSFSGRNLFILWREQTTLGDPDSSAETLKYGAHIADPEYGTSSAAGSNWFIEPPLSTVTATLRVTF